MIVAFVMQSQGILDHTLGFFGARKCIYRILFPNTSRSACVMKIHPLGAFDNSAKDYSEISVKPLAAAMGAEIHGVQI